MIRVHIKKNIPLKLKKRLRNKARLRKKNFWNRRKAQVSGFSLSETYLRSVDR